MVSFGFSTLSSQYPAMHTGAANLASLGASVPFKQGILEVQPHSQACDLG